MRRLMLLSTCLILAIGLLGPAALAQSNDSAATAPSGPSSHESLIPAPSTLVGIFDVRATSGDTWVKVSWTTNVTATTSLAYGTSATTLSNTLGDDRGDSWMGYTHFVTIPTLTASTTYYADVTSAAGSVSLTHNNHGAHWTVTTQGALTAPTSSQNFGFRVVDGDTSSSVISDTLGYVRVQRGTVMSELVQVVPDPANNSVVTVDLAMIRSGDGSAYFEPASGDSIWAYADAGENGYVLVGTTLNSASLPYDLDLTVLDAGRWMYQAIDIAQGYTLIGFAVDPVALAMPGFFAEGYKVSDLLRDFNGAPSTSAGNNLFGDSPYVGARYTGSGYELFTKLAGFDPFGNDFDVEARIDNGEGLFVFNIRRGTAYLRGGARPVEQEVIGTGFSLIGGVSATNAEDLLLAMQAQGLDVQQIFRFTGFFQGYGIGGVGIAFPINSNEGYFVRNFGSAGVYVQTGGNESQSSAGSSGAAKTLNAPLPADIDAAVPDIQVSNVTNQGFTISWLSDSAETGAVLSGTASGSLTNVSTDDRGSLTSSRLHYVSVTGLDSETQYFYQVTSGGNNVASEASLTTGSLIFAAPSVNSISGQINGSTGAGIESIVYFNLRPAGAADSSSDSPLYSTMTGSTGAFTIDLGAVRNNAGLAYLAHDNNNTIVVSAEAGPIDATFTDQTASGTSSVGAAKVDGLNLTLGGPIPTPTVTPLVAVDTPTPTATATSCPDIYEPDSVISSTLILPVAGVPQTQSHTLHEDGDVDWVTVAATANYSYTIEVLNTGALLDAVLASSYLSGNTVVTETVDDFTEGVGEALLFEPSTNMSVTVWVADSLGQGGCNNYGYDLRVVINTTPTVPSGVLIPIVFKNVSSSSW